MLQVKLYCNPFFCQNEFVTATSSYPKCIMMLRVHQYLFPKILFFICSTADENRSKSDRAPFNNDAYSAFKRGNVVKGILCPSLTNSFRSRSLERSYLTYSHRQRQKSLLIVNIVDLVLKIVLAIIWTFRQTNMAVI